MGSTTVIVGVQYEEHKPETYQGVTLKVSILNPSQPEINAIVDMCNAAGQEKALQELGGKPLAEAHFTLRAYVGNPVEDWSFIQRLLSYWTHATILHSSSVNHFTMDGGTLEQE